MNNAAVPYGRVLYKNILCCALQDYLDYQNASEISYCIVLVFFVNENGRL